MIEKSQSTRNNDPLLIVYTLNNAHRGKKAGRHGVQKHTCEVQFVLISDILGDTVGVLVCRSSCREYRPLETMLVVVLHIDTGLRKTERRTSTRAMIFSWIICLITFLLFRGVGSSIKDDPVKGRYSAMSTNRFSTRATDHELPFWTCKQRDTGMIRNLQVGSTIERTLTQESRWPLISSWLLTMLGKISVGLKMTFCWERKYGFAISPSSRASSTWKKKKNAKFTCWTEAYTEAEFCLPGQQSSLYTGAREPLPPTVRPRDRKH